MKKLLWRAKRYTRISFSAPFRSKGAQKVENRIYIVENFISIVENCVSICENFISIVENFCMFVVENIISIVENIICVISILENNYIHMQLHFTFP